MVSFSDVTNPPFSALLLGEQTYQDLQYATLPLGLALVHVLVFERPYYVSISKYLLPHSCVYYVHIITPFLRSCFIWPS